MRDAGMPRRGGFVLLAFAVFAAILGGGVAVAQDYVPEWEQHRPWPPDGSNRPAEYRTVDTDTWIRLSPYIGSYGFAEDLELDGKIAPDWSMNFGFRLEFEPAQLMLLTFDLGIGGRMASGIGGNVEREKEQMGSPAAGTYLVDDFGLKVLHFAFYIALKNPELSFGPVAFMPGLGFGMFRLFDSDNEALYYDPTTGTVVSQNLKDLGAQFEDTLLIHATAFLRADFDISPQFKFGIDVKLHLPLYSSGDTVGGFPKDEFEVSTDYYILEPTLYVSYAF